MKKIQHVINKIRDNRLLKNSGIYVSGNIIQKASEFIFLPLWTRFLTPSEYGIVGTLTAYNSLLLPIITMNLYNYISLSYFEQLDNSEKQKESISSIVLLQIFYSIIIFFILLFLGYIFWEQRISTQIPFYPYIPYLLLTALFSSLLRIPLTIFQAEQHSKKYVITQYSIFLLNFISSLIFIVTLKMGAEGYFLSVFLANFIVGIITITIIFKKWFILKIDWTAVKTSIIYGLPLVPRNIAASISRSVDRIIQERYIPLNILGHYSLGFKISSIIDNIVTSVTLAWMPEYFRLRSSKNYKSQKINEYFQYYVVSLGFVCLLLILFIDIVIKLLFPSTYFDSIIYIRPITFGLFINGIGRFLVMPLFYNKQTQKLLLISVIGSTSSLLLNLLFIPKIGAIASAWITILIQSIIVILDLTFVNKYQDFSTEYSFISKNILVFFICVFIMQNISFSIIIEVLFRIGILLLFYILNVKTIRKIYKIIF